MASLTISKTYSDDSLLSASDLNAIIDSVETFVNTTGLNDDNINSASITGSTVIKTASITTAKIADNAVTTTKIADAAVTTTKIANSAVTAAKIAEDTLLSTKFYTLAPLASPGSVIMFHTFNGAVSVPRGWMICNGDQISESNYNTLHSAGAYEADSISSSPLLAKFTPNMVNKYPKGVGDTTQTGGTAISSLGNADNSAAWDHSHTISTHSHSSSLTGEGSGNLSSAYNVYRHGAGAWLTDFNSQTVESPDPTDIQPESIEFIYLMKVI